MSAPFDYSGLRAVADSLIPSFGVEATLTRPSRAAVEPWQQDQGPAASSAAQSITVSAVRVSLDKETLDLQTIETQLGRFAVTADAALPEEVGPEWSLVSNGLTYPIVSCSPVQPGDTLLLYFVVVRL